MNRNKDSGVSRGTPQEGTLRGDTVDMEDVEEDETKAFKLYKSDEDEETNAHKVPAQESTSTSSQNGDIKLTHGYCLDPEEWPADDHERDKALRKRNSENELTVYLLDEELNASKTEKVTKDTLLVIPNNGKKGAISPSARNVNERSLPVSLKIQKKTLNSGEINNNVDDIQPQFKELSLHSPTSIPPMKNGKQENTTSAVKCFRFYVEASCMAGSSQTEVLNILYEPLFESRSSLGGEQEQELDSSGHLGDVSKTISSLSDSPMTYIPPPRMHLTRMSYVSSTSSGSSIPSSAMMLSQKQQKHPIKAEGLTQARINYLNKKWKNSNLVYGILDYIDKIIADDISGDYQVVVNKNHSEKNTHNQMNLESVLEENLLSSRKRHLSPEHAVSSISKRAKSSFEELLGSEIFAKWQNRKYYFAHVTDILDENHLQVTFLDTTVRTVTRDQIITELDSLIGHKIMVTDDAEGDQYYPGIATSFVVEDGVFKYSVLTDSGDFEASVAQIYFTEHQAKLIKQGVHAIPRINVDISGSSGLYPGCSGMQKELLDTTSETDGSPSKIHSDTESHKHIMGCDVETNDPQNLNPSVKLKNVQGKLPKRSNKNEDSLLGPLKYKGTWFKGLCFMVTCSTRAVSSSTEEVQSGSEDYPFTRVPFVYDRLVQQIKLGSGEVFDKFEDVHPAKYNNTYLVTNRPCLTPKYLKCLAAGITIVCHEWIVNCTIKQKRQPLFDLPAGWSVESNRFINMSDRKTSQPLSGLHIKLAQLTDKHFYKFWSNICNVIGASTSIFTGNFENTTVIIAENGLKDAMLDKASAFGIPIVSASWIIQSVIHGEARLYDGHASYSHLYEETEEF